MTDIENTVEPSKSILQQAEHDGYVNGKRDTEKIWLDKLCKIERGHAQINQCTYDDGYLKGQQEAETKYPSRFTWFIVDFAIFAIGLVSFVLWNR